MQRSCGAYNHIILREINFGLMTSFTIRDIENLSGIKAHTWRIWEQRYNICLPQRKDSNHRFYDSDDLKQVLRISFLYHSGIKISKIAMLQPNEMEEMAASQSSLAMAPNYFIKQLLEAAIDSDEIKFEAICDEIFEKYDTEQAVLNIIYPFVERVGVLWLTDHIIPAQEHFTTNIIQRKIIAAIDHLPAIYHQAEPIILFTPAKEHHELPLLFIHYLLKKNGKKTRYFGCNIKLKDLQQYVNNFEAATLHFHLLTNLTNKDAQQYLDTVATTFPDKTIVMSGRLVEQVNKKPANVKLLTAMQAILTYAKQ